MSHLKNLKLPDFIDQANFTMMGLAGLSHDCIASVTFELDVNNRIKILYVAESHFPLKTLVVHQNYQDYETDEAIYVLLDRTNKEIITLEFSNLKLLSVRWTTDTISGGPLVLELEYDYGSVR